MKINYSQNLKLKEKLLIKKTIIKTLKFLNQPLNIEVGVSFVSDQEIKDLNKETRRVDKVTDVLSFPALEISAGENVAQKGEQLFSKNIYIGDVVVCRPQIERQAKEYSQTFYQELVRMVLHSTLHLLGYDHIKASDEEKMHAVEFPIYEKLTKIKLK